MDNWRTYTLDYDTPLDAELQGQLETIDARLRSTYDIRLDQVGVGLLDLKQLRLAMLQPDRLEYAASVAKIGILLAYFELVSHATAALSTQSRHELGLMIKTSS